MSFVKWSTSEHVGHHSTKNQLTMKLVVGAGLLLFSLVSPIVCKKVQLFQFYDQSLPVSSAKVKETMNFATLSKSALVGQQWSICSSMYVGFIRGRLNFFALSRKNPSQPWLTIYRSQERKSSMIILKVQGKSYIMGWYKQRLTMHSWSHVCLSIDGTSGHVASAVDGQPMRNFTIQDLRTAEGIDLDKRLVLGITWTGDSVYQSESSVGNVHAYDTILTQSVREDASTSGVFPENAVLAWNPSDWIRTGGVTIRFSELPNWRIGELMTFSEVDSWENCARLCPRLLKGGRLPPVGNTDITRKLKELGTQDSYIPAPYTDINKEGSFVNIYDKTHMLNDTLFDGEEPNGGRHENCVMWTPKIDGTFIDYECGPKAVNDIQCFCLFDQGVLLKLRGLCPESYLDSLYTIKNEGGRIVLRGPSGTEIVLDKSFFLPSTYMLQKV